MHAARLLHAIRKASGASPYRMPDRVYDPESDRRGRPRTRVSDSLEALLDARRSDAHAAASRPTERESSGSRDFAFAIGVVACVALALALVAIAFGGATLRSRGARSNDIVIVPTNKPPPPSARALSVLQGRVYGGDASPGDVALLRSICRDRADTACVAKCDEVAAEMVLEQRSEGPSPP